MKTKLKFIILSIFVFSLVGCAGLIKQQPLDNMSVKGNDIWIGHPDDPMDKEFALTYKEKEIRSLDYNYGSKKLNIRDNVTLKFESNFKKMKFEGIENRGSMDFDAERDENLTLSMHYIIDTGDEKLRNYNQIKVVDFNNKCALMVKGNYYGGSKSKIILGLSTQKNGEEYFTNGVYINGDVEGKTKVKFVYDEDRMEDIKKNAKGISSCAISVIGNAPKKAEHFELETPVVIGKHVFKMEYEKTEDMKVHKWILKKTK